MRSGSSQITNTSTDEPFSRGVGSVAMRAPARVRVLVGVHVLAVALQVLLLAGLWPGSAARPRCVMLG